MRLKKEDFYKKIENRVKQGVVEGEEIDVTAKNIVKDIWPIIDYLQLQNSTLNKAVLTPPNSK